MALFVSISRLKFLVKQFRNRLWLKPLVVCLISVAAVFVAKFADNTGLAQLVPEVAKDSIETLLSIMASSMLVIATFSVSSMVSAYAAAASTATPRAFTVVVADNASQNALSTFVGSFIFSVVALTAVKSEAFGEAGLFILFSMTVGVFAIVILTFVRWVDRIARLGRLASTIKKVEAATAEALQRRGKAPRLCGVSVEGRARGRAVVSERVGYVQDIDVSALQSWAQEAQVHVVVAALPGTLVSPGRPLAYVSVEPEDAATASDKIKIKYQQVVESFQVGDDRLFDEDPRFGLVVLSEIASRALSPAVNDPGTAIKIIGSLLRLFIQWNESAPAKAEGMPQYDRVAVPEVSVSDMFDDAFTGIARDGAGLVEVSIRLQKALHSLASSDNAELRDAAMHHARLALKRSQMSLKLKEDLAVVEAEANFAQ